VDGAQTQSFHNSTCADEVTPNKVVPDNFIINNFVLMLPNEMGLLYCIHF